MVDAVLLGIMSVLIPLFNVAYACDIDIRIIKTTLRRPIGVAIALFCQFFLMPTVRYLVIL